MSEKISSVAQTLPHLGVKDPARVGALFAEVRAAFDRDVSSAGDEASWKILRDAWLGRKSGVLTLVTDNWLKPASPGLKRAVGAALNQLRAHVEAQIEERRKALQASTEQTALAREHVRSEEHTSELQSRLHLVCRLLLEKKKNKNNTRPPVV